jgi:hypothetical protein
MASFMILFDLAYYHPFIGVYGPYQIDYLIYHKIVRPLTPIK